MSKQLIIGIAGEIGSGKDHVMGLLAGYIARESKSHVSKDITVYRFADPIKTGISGMFRQPYDLLYNDEGKRRSSPVRAKYHSGNQSEIARTYGELQQNFGDFLRSLDKDIFKNMLVSRIINTPGTIIVPDLRYPNELRGLLQFRSAVKYRLILIKLVGKYKTKTDNRDANHSSELEVDKLPNSEFDYIINPMTYKDEDMKYMIKQLLIQQKIL